VQSELARPSIAPYTATKGAVKNLTRGMCADWAKYGLQINGIGPGYFRTPLNQALVDNPEFSAWLEKRTPAARWGDVEELVGAAVFLAGKSSSFINGHMLYVDGGITTSLRRRGLCDHGRLGLRQELRRRGSRRRAARSFRRRRHAAPGIECRQDGARHRPDR
jgi:hypothetical protein